MKKPFDREALTTEIPQINLIKNDELKEKTIKAWELAYADSKFEDLTSVLFSPFYPKPTLLGHTRAVTRASIALAEIIKDEYSEYDIDMDTVICTAVLHDISKLLECEPGGEFGSKKSQRGKDFQHAFFSAHYALEVGLPDKIISAIFAHTGNTKQIPTSFEGIIVTYGDINDADMHRFATDRPLHVAKIHKA